MSNPWARHYQLVWQERAGSPDLPDWLRIAAAAYGHHRANGHATFRTGHLALILARPDLDGQMRPLDRRHVFRAIQTAIDYGWLAQRSTARCLIVPPHAITGGLGNPHDPCPQHAHQRPTLRAVS